MIIVLAEPAITVLDSLFPRNRIQHWFEDRMAQSQKLKYSHPTECRLFVNTRIKVLRTHSVGPAVLEAKACAFVNWRPAVSMSYGGMFAPMRTSSPFSNWTTIKAVFVSLS